MPGIPDRIVELERKVAVQERRSRSRRRTGTIGEVDHGKGRYRVKIAGSDRHHSGAWPALRSSFRW